MNLLRNLKMAKISRKKLRELIHKVLEEQSASGAAGGYLTKHAFTNPKQKENRATKYLKKQGFKKPGKHKSKALDVIRWFEESKTYKK